MKDELKGWQVLILGLVWLNLYVAEKLMKFIGVYEYAVEHGFLPPVDASGKWVNVPDSITVSEEGSSNEEDETKG